VGALVGAALGGIIVPRLGVARLLARGLTAAGVLLLAYSRLTSLGPALALIFILGMAQAAVNLSAGPLILHAAPREYVGRVAAVINPAVTFASMLSILVAGMLASTALRGLHATLLGLRFGAVDTIFSAAGVLILLGGLYAATNLRGVRLAGERGAVTPLPTTVGGAA
jgi:hypothetical protein